MKPSRAAAPLLRTPSVLSLGAAHAAEHDMQRRVARACKADIQKLCEGIKPGEDRIASGLEDQTDRLSGGFKDALKDGTETRQCGKTGSRSWARGDARHCVFLPAMVGDRLDARG
jgi:hypothetical protein